VAVVFIARGFFVLLYMCLGGSGSGSGWVGVGGCEGDREMAKLDMAMKHEKNA
jgi:hypothetical protein